MKTIVALIALMALLAVPGIAVTEKEAGYIIGIEEGYALGVLHQNGLTNATAAREFNARIQAYNEYLVSIGALNVVMAEMVVPVITVPIAKSSADIQQSPYIRPIVHNFTANNGNTPIQSIEANSADAALQNFLKS
jgi:hypothetical protein